MLVAAVQLTSKADKAANLARAKELMTEAVRRGAGLVAIPEYFPCIGSKAETWAAAEEPGKGAAYELARDFARDNGVHVLAGTIATLGTARENVRSAGDRSRALTNRSTLFGPDGRELAHYDKIHLFDAELSEMASYRESDTFVAGDRIVVADTAFGKVGFSVCYDLRFPELFRALAAGGARIIFVPSAFTLHTGKDHWLTLLRARAIENQVYIVAPAQLGSHAPDKTSYGKSCVIDPWGTVLAQAPERESVIVAEVDFAAQDRVRRALPALGHRRKDLFPF